MPAVADLRGGASGGNCLLPFTKEIHLGAPFFGEKCAPHRDPKTLLLIISIEFWANIQITKKTKETCGDLLKIYLPS